MIYTVGHSTMTESEFAALLHSAGIQTLIDIRSHPTSKWPQFRKEFIERFLPREGINYEWEPRLGGWTSRHSELADYLREHNVNVKAYGSGKFPKQRIAAIKTADPAAKPTWTNQGLYDYSWFMSLPEFMEGSDDLMARTDDVAIMCCELLWWKCHRSMVADYLVYRGRDAIHLQPKTVRHVDVISNRLERYDPAIVEKWRRWEEKHGKDGVEHRDRPES